MIRIAKIAGKTWIPVAAAVALILLFSGQQTRGTAMPVADSPSSSASGTGKSLSWTHTVNAGSGRILLVGISYDKADKSVTGVTFGSSALTRAGSEDAPGKKNGVEVWYLLAPPVVSNTITVTLSGPTSIVGGAVSFSGVDQTNPLGSFESAHGTDTDPSVTLSSSSEQVVFDTVSAETTIFPPPPPEDPDKKVQWNLTEGKGGSEVDGAGSTKPGAPSVTMSWTLSKSKAWAIGAIALNPVGSGGGSGSGACPACKLGYPSAGPLKAAVVFNESEVLRAFDPPQGCTSNANGTIKLWYNDEHALTLGVHQVTVIERTCIGGSRNNKTCTANNGNNGCPAGTCGRSIPTPTTYTVSQMTTNPGHASPVLTGSNAQTGDQAGTDTNTCGPTGFECGRPMWPALFITDITADSTSRSGDWQYGGTPIGPNDVFGTWKAAIKTVDKTQSPTVVTVTPDADPAKNDWNLGPDADPAPAGLTNQGYGAEVRWNIGSLRVNNQPLIAGHLYRLQFMVHDGDQNKAGGDSGEACVNVRVPGTDLGITKGVHHFGSYTSNPVDYFITVKNYGPFTANSVMVTDVLPSKMTFESCKITSEDGLTVFGDCSGTMPSSGASGTVRATLGNMAVDQSITLKLTVRVSAGPNEFFYNTASVDSDTPDPCTGSSCLHPNSAMTTNQAGSGGIPN